MAADRRTEAGPCAVDHGLPVDRHHQGLAHALVVEGLAGIVHAGDDLEFGIADLGREAGVAIEGAHQLRCGEFRKGVEIAGFQGRGLCLRIVDEAEGHLVELGGTILVPVIGILGEFHMVALGPGGEFERPGADRRRLVIGGGLRPDHDGSRPAEPVDQAAGRVGKMQHQRFGVRRIDGGDRREEALLRIDGILPAGAVECKLGGGRIEGLAVVEFDTALQLERIGQPIRGNFPALGELRLHLTGLVDANKTFEDVLPGHLADRDRCGDRRVESSRLDAHAEIECGLGGFGGRQRQHHDAGGKCNAHGKTPHETRGRRERNLDHPVPLFGSAAWRIPFASRVALRQCTHNDDFVCSA